MKRTDVGRMMFAVCLFFSFSGMALADDPYLHSDGTQCIDTGYVVKSTTRVELDMQLDAAVKGNQYFFGTLGDREGKLAFCSYVNSDGKHCYCCRKDASDWVSTGFDASTERRTIVLDGFRNVFSVIVGGVTNYTRAISGAHDGCDSGVTMPVFAAYSFYANSYSGYSAFRLFSLKIYEEDVLVRDFVPCVWDGEAGLKDRIGGALYTAKGGNPLRYGGDGVLVDDGYVMSSGDQYIDTEYHAKGTSRLEIDMAFVDVETAPGKYPFGVHVDDSGLISGMYVNAAGYCGWNFADRSANWATFDRLVETKRRTYVIDGAADKCCVVAHGITNKVVDITTEHVNETLQSLVLFGSRINSEISGKLAMKLYGFKAYESGVLVRDFVPCVKAGNVGLKEMVSGKFFYARSTDSSKPLTAGGDILREQDDPYVKSDGFQAFSTGIKVDSTTRIELDFAPDRVTGTQYLFGSTTPYSGHLIFGAYITDGQLTVNCQVNQANWQSIGSVEAVRQQLIVDVLKGKVKVYAQGRLVHEKDITAERGSAESPICTKRQMPLLGTSNDGSEPVYITAAKVYGFKVYRNEVLANDFKPYVKDCVVGMRDGIEDTFIASPRLVTSFGAAGEIEANVEEDAFVSSDQRQAIDTGYIVNGNSRIEIDFAFNQHTNGLERVFGSTSGGDYRFGLYAGSTQESWGSFCFAAGPSGEKYDTTIPVDVKRRTAIMDMPKKWMLLVEGSVTNYWSSFAALPSGTVWPLWLFGEPADESFTDAAHLSNLRIYSVKISENGRIVHHFLPYASRDSVGFKDVVTGSVKEDVLDSGFPFTVGGCGWGESHSPFYENPRSGYAAYDEPLVLSAFAPGAVSYRWLKDGLPIQGATDETYTVSWQRRAPEAEYTVEAGFIRYGVPVKSVSAAAAVGNRSPGSCIIVR